MTLNEQEISFPRQFYKKYARKHVYLCPTFLPIPAFAQTLTAHPFINSSFSAILGISRIQLAQVSND
jgi:hypothetical protein